MGNSTLLWDCVLPSTDLLGVGSCTPSQSSKPSLLQGELWFSDFIICRLFSLSVMCNSQQRYQLQAGSEQGAGAVLCSAGIALMFNSVSSATSDTFSQNLLMSARPLVWFSFYTECTECYSSLDMSDCCLDAPLCIPEPQNHRLVWVGTLLIFLFFFLCWKAVYRAGCCKKNYFSTCKL